jgi:hypothetical protein
MIPVIKNALTKSPNIDRKGIIGALALPRVETPPE